MGYSMKNAKRKTAKSKPLAPDNLKDTCVFKEGMLSAVCCAPRKWTRRQVQEWIGRNIGASGTSAGWVVSTRRKFDGKPHPVACGEYEDRRHWLVEC